VGRSVRHTVGKINWLEAALFFGSGYYLKPALDASGIPLIIYSMVPQWKNYGLP
jgi:hypothetical protein